MSYQCSLPKAGAGEVDDEDGGIGRFVDDKIVPSKMAQLRPGNFGKRRFQTC